MPEHASLPAVPTPGPAPASVPARPGPPDLQRSLDATGTMLRAARDQEQQDRLSEIPQRLLHLGPALKHLRHSDTPAGRTLRLLARKHGQLVYPTPEAQVKGASWPCALAIPSGEGTLLLTSPGRDTVWQVIRVGDTLSETRLEHINALNTRPEALFSLTGPQDLIRPAPADWATADRRWRWQLLAQQLVSLLLGLTLFSLPLVWLVHDVSTRAEPTPMKFLLGMVSLFAGLALTVQALSALDHHVSPLPEALHPDRRELRRLALTLPTPPPAPAATPVSSLPVKTADLTLQLHTLVSTERPYLPAALQERLTRVQRDLDRTGLEERLGPALSALIEARQLSAEENPRLDQLMDAPLLDLEAQIDTRKEEIRLENQRQAEAALTRLNPTAQRAMTGAADTSSPHF